MMANIDDLKLDKTNARKRDKRAQETLQHSLDEFGAARSVVIDKDGIVRAGNGTVEAAKAAGITKVKVIKGKPDELVVVKRDDLDGERAQAYAIADNRTGELAEWDSDILKEQLDGFGDFSPSDLGFSDSDLKDILPVEEPEIEDIEPQLDRADELLKKWKVKKGQLWSIEGRQSHRLLCGDSTKKEDVERLMGGATADLVFTSPPYGQQRDYDEESGVDLSDWDALMMGVFNLLPVNNKTQVLVNLGLIHRKCEWVPYWDGWISFMRKQGWRRFGWYVWDQMNGLPGDWNGRLAPSFEFVFHFNRHRAKTRKTVKTKGAGEINGSTVGFNKAGGSKPFNAAGVPIEPFKVADSVLRVCRSSSAGVYHSGTMAIGLAELVVSSWPGDIYDPFLGSGTTMLAAEQLNRRCYGMEISPKYCAVILERMADAGCECKVTK